MVAAGQIVVGRFAERFRSSGMASLTLPRSFSALFSWLLVMRRNRLRRLTSRSPRVSTQVIGLPPSSAQVQPGSEPAPRMAVPPATARTDRPSADGCAQALRVYPQSTSCRPLPKPVTARLLLCKCC